MALRSYDTVACNGKRCEMKRLFVLDKFRGHGLGKMLVEQIILDARAIGYSEILLDSFTSMESAIALYQKFGFEEIAPYRFNPHNDVKYLRLYL